jgi:hypothetical protein
MFDAQLRAEIEPQHRRPSRQLAPPHELGVTFGIRIELPHQRHHPD